MATKRIPGLSWRVLAIFTFFLIVVLAKYDKDCDAEPDDDYDEIKTPSARLLQRLLDTYGPTSPRPVLDVNRTMYVGLEVKPASLISFEEQSQMITLKSNMLVTWVDEQLIWDPANHGGVETLDISVDEIWTPDLTVPESSGESFEVHNNMIATVDYNGNVAWHSIAVTETFCKLLVRYFPFDVQHCNITYISWLYERKRCDRNRKILTPGSSGVLQVTQRRNAFLEISFTHFASSEAVVDAFVKNGMWQLSDISVDDSLLTYCDGCEAYSYVRFTFEFERTEASFFALNVILPCILLSMMNLLVFFLPPESGEKISFVMTNVLTLVLFQQLVAAMLPASGDDTPLLSSHIVILIVFGCVAIVWTVFVTNLFHKTTPYPKWLYSIVTSFRFLYRRTQFGKEEAKARKTMRESRDGLDEGHTELNNVDQEDGRQDGTGHHQNEKQKIQIFSCFKCGKESPTIVKEKLRRKKPRINFDPKDARLWQETANLLDKFMGYAMIVVTILIYIILLWNFVGHDPHTYQREKH